MYNYYSNYFCDFLQNQFMQGHTLNIKYRKLFDYNNPLRNNRKYLKMLHLNIVGYLVNGILSNHYSSVTLSF